MSSVEEDPDGTQVTGASKQTSGNIPATRGMGTVCSKGLDGGETPGVDVEIEEHEKGG